MRRPVLAVMLLALLGSPLSAQTPRATHVPPLVKYGKWALLAGAVGLNLTALHQNHVANDIFAQLEDRCTTAAHALCATDGSGRYLDPGSEGIYQASLQADRHARAWLISGESVLLGSAALFVWELARPKRPSKNIPFTPQVRTRGGRTTLGIRVPL